jgi:3-oxoacyl-[acyl-carrier protein] reductase
MRLLEGKKAVITGGTSGIGKAIAMQYAAHGADVIIIGKNEEKARKVIAELQQSGRRKYAYYLCDVADTEKVGNVMQQILADWQTVDILVNCAGITKDKLLMRMEQADWDDVIQVNLRSVYNFSKPLIRPMMKAKQGRIINISSVIGLTGNPGQVNYAASKAGMIGFSKSLAKEVATKGITVNTIAPGFIKTPMTDELSEEQQKNILNQVPMARFGNPEEIAGAALFLASDLAGYITGEVIAVDGGMIA